jgi:hypothetical protein
VSAVIPSVRNVTAVMVVDALRLVVPLTTIMPPAVPDNVDVPRQLICGTTRNAHVRRSRIT